jgi:peptide/nickel transport system substrate-binding protein
MVKGLVASTARRRQALVAVLLAATLGAMVTAATSSASTRVDGTLVVNKSFDLKTVDPQREFEVTGNMITHVLYDTLLQFVGGDVANPRPSVATGYKASPDAKVYTFTLRKDVKFSDGTPLTAKDVVYSFNRLVNIKGNPSFLLAGVKTTAKDDYTVVLSSATSNPALPAIVANASLGIVNSALVKKNGGFDGPGADKKDKAEAFLNKTSAGSGPYILKSFDTTSKVELVENPSYWNKVKPNFKSVVIRNMQAPAQLLSIQRGTNELALDLSPAQAKPLASSSKVTAKAVAGPNVWFLLANANPEVSEVTSNKRFQNAIRYGLDYAGIVKLVGDGSVRAAGVIPTMFAGAIPSGAGIKTNLNKAKAELAASGVTDPKVELEFPSDFTSNGISFGVIAQKIQADLAKVGITVELKGAPIATSLANYRAGTEQLGLWLWGPDYPDPNDYLVFLPGQLVGLRAGWKEGDLPSLEALGKKAGSTPDPAKRTKLFQQLQKPLIEQGPFFPLFQPGQVVASSKNLTGVVFNTQFTVDLARIGSK